MGLGGDMANLVIVTVALLYVTLLFAVAHHYDQKQLFFRPSPRRSYTYALALAIYCTSWTFFGSVGMAADSGVLFLTIYIGPILVFTLGYPFLRRMVSLAKSQRSTSIADFIAARYGKSFLVALVATVIATVGTIPYIALQLKAIASSVSIMSSSITMGEQLGLDIVWGAADAVNDHAILAFTIAMFLALFAILFGTRHADATEHQDGLFNAVAVESVIAEHYQEQLDTLGEGEAELKKTIAKFREDELEHHDIGLEHEAEQTPMYGLLSEVIKAGCHAAIWASKKV